jgi:hypothetical protein
MLAVVELVETNRRSNILAVFELVETNRRSNMLWVVELVETNHPQIKNPLLQSGFFR